MTSPLAAESPLVLEVYRLQSSGLLSAGQRNVDLQLRIYWCLLGFGDD